jgi:RHS repeat-associated protein
MGSPQAEGAPPACPDSNIATVSTPFTYPGAAAWAMIWVKNGWTVDVAISGKTEAKWTSNDWRTQTLAQLFLYEGDATTQVWHSGQLGGVNGHSAGVFPWGPVDAGSWTNNGSDRVIFVKLQGYLYLSGPGEFKAELSISGPDVTGGRLCPVPAETMGPNPAAPNLDDAQGEGGDPVNTATGNFHLPVTDLVVAGRGPGLNASRAYNSLDADSVGSFGPGWSWTYGMSLDVNTTTGEATVTQEGGARVNFTLTNGVWLPPTWVQATLTDSGNGTWVFVRNGRDRFEFSADGRLVEITDLNGYSTTLDYNATTGKLEIVTDESNRTATDGPNRTMTVAWDGDRIASITDSTSPARAVTYEYDTDGQLVLVTDEAGGEWGYGYDSGGDHRLEWATDPKQAGESSPARLENTYDGSGRVISQVDRAGMTTTFDYTTLPGATIVTDPDGYKTADLQENGVRIRTTKGYDTPAAVSWEFQYDAATLGITKVTDPNANEWIAGYDAAGNRISTQDPLGRTTSATFNAWNLPATVTDAENVTTTFGFDGAGNLETVSTPLDLATTRTITYHRDNSAHPADVTSMVDERGNTWLYGYDAYGYPNSLTDPLGNEATATLNDLGWVTNTVAPRGNAPGGIAADFESVFTHDAYGNVLTVDGPEGASDVRTYDDNRNLETVTDAENKTTTYSYDDDDKLIGITRPDSTSVSNDYTDAGRLWKQIDTAGQQTVFTYDPVGRLVTQTDPTGAVTGFGYDPAGNLVLRQDPGGDCTTTPKIGCVTNSYDDANQLIAVDYTDPATADITSVSYDDNGRRLSVTNANSETSSWAWDALGRMTSSAVGSRTTTYGYDGTSALVDWVQGPSGPAVTRTFDDTGRLTAVNDSASRQAGFGYDADSNWTSTTFPGAVNVDTYGVDNAGRMTTASYAQGATTLASLTFGRNDLGLVTGEDLTDLPGTDSTFGYNDLNQLESINTDTFDYDTASNLTVMPGVVQGFGGGGQLCWTASSGSGDCANPPAGATTFSYDERGNRITETPGDGPETRYSWNQTNLLTEVEVPTQSAREGLFTSLAPTRVADTRTPTQTGTCPTLSSECVQIPVDGSRTVQVTGQSGIPATGIDAVSLRVTAVDATGDGRMSVDPAGAPAAPTADVAYSDDGPTSATVLTAVSSTGAITLTVDGAATDVTVDIDGYYTTPGQPGGTYTPVAATRLIDTTDTGTQPACVGTCDRLVATDTLVAQITGQAGTPSTGVAAVALNVTTIDPSASGALSVWASDDATSAPADPTVAFNDDPATTKLVIAEVSPGGRISVLNNALSGSADVTIDVIGWFSDTFRAEGSTFHPIADVSLIDTTTNTRSCSILQPNDELTLSVANLADVPDGIVAVSLNVTTINGGSDDHLTVYEPATTAPNTPSVQFAPSAVRSNAVIAPVDDNGDVALLATQEVGVAITVNGYFTSAADTDTYTYTYDADGLRSSKTGPDGTTTYDWDKTGALPLLIAETTGTDTTHYIYGPGGLAYQQINPDGSVTYLHHDQLGSTRLLTNELGATTGSATYRPYGALEASTGALSTLGYAGQYTDAETGSQYLRARYYDPDTGQFLSRDPLTVLTGEPYGYAGGNPTNANDPTGLFWEGPIGSKLRVAGQVIVVTLAVVGVGACIISVSCGVVAATAMGAAGGAGWYMAGNAGSDRWDPWDLVAATATGAAMGAGGYQIGSALGLGSSGAAGAAGAGSVEGGAQITFGHGARHLAGTGLSQEAVESTIAAQVRTSISNATSSGSFWGRVAVDGVTLEYRAYTLADGTINVGTYYVP